MPAYGVLIHVMYISIDSICKGLTCTATGNVFESDRELMLQGFLQSRLMSAFGKFYYRYNDEMTKITNRNQSHKSYRKYKSENGRTRTSEYIGGGIRCHEGVSLVGRSHLP
jgi:hypothetical protein